LVINFLEEKELNKKTIRKSNMKLAIEGKGIYGLGFGVIIDLIYELGYSFVA